MHDVTANMEKHDAPTSKLLHIEVNDGNLNKNVSPCASQIRLDNAILGERLTLMAGFWEEHWTYKKSLSQNCTDDFNEVFKKKYPLYILSFKRHFCSVSHGRGNNRENKPQTKTKVLFPADAVCLNSTCTKF